MSSEAVAPRTCCAVARIPTEQLAPGWSVAPMPQVLLATWNHGESAPSGFTVVIVAGLPPALVIVTVCTEDCWLMPTVPRSSDAGFAVSVAGLPGLPGVPGLPVGPAAPEPGDEVSEPEGVAVAVAPVAPGDGDEAAAGGGELPV